VTTRDQTQQDIDLEAERKKLESLVIRDKALPNYHQAQT